MSVAFVPFIRGKNNCGPCRYWPRGIPIYFSQEIKFCVSRTSLGEWYRLSGSRTLAVHALIPDKRVLIPDKIANPIILSSKLEKCPLREMHQPQLRIVAYKVGENIGPGSGTPREGGGRRKKTLCSKRIFSLFPDKSVLIPDKIAKPYYGEERGGGF